MDKNQNEESKSLRLQNQFFSTLPAATTFVILVIATIGNYEPIVQLLLLVVGLASAAISYAISENAYTLALRLGAEVSTKEQSGWIAVLVAIAVPVLASTTPVLDISLNGVLGLMVIMNALLGYPLYRFVVIQVVGVLIRFIRR